MSRLRWIVACALLSAQVASAQAAPRTYTFADIFSSLHAGENAIGFAAARPVPSAHLTSLEGYFSRIHLVDVTLDELTSVYTNRDVGLLTVARWNRDRWAVGVIDSIAAVTSIANADLYPGLKQRLSKSALDSLWAPIDSLQDKVLAVQLAANKEILRRFFVKYGPDAPQLNAAEVLLNYVAQLALPGFLPSVDGSPSPNELVATYRTTDLTASQTATDPFRAHIVTSAQLGLRRYNFGADCGTGRFADLLRPCQQSFGGFLVGPTDTPLNSPWQLRHRGGVYWARGKYHLGAVFGGERRIVFGVDQQLLPYVF
jgi:hypothetical protein